MAKPQTNSPAYPPIGVLTGQGQWQVSRNHTYLDTTAGDSPRPPCPHAIDHREIVEQSCTLDAGSSIITTITHQWTIPSIVYNSTTILCLDCILDAFKALDTKGKGK